MNRKTIWSTCITLTCLALSCEQHLVMDPNDSKPTISIDTSSLELSIGETYQFSAKCDYGKEYEAEYFWDVTDEDIAFISSTGLLTALREGDVITRVEALVTSGSRKFKIYSDCMVKIHGPAIEKILLNQNKINITRGEGIQLTHTIIPTEASYKNVIWESQDETIAIVSEDGYVLGVSTGETTIKVSIPDTELFATCNVTVEPILATNIRILNAPSKLYINDTCTLSYELIPELSETREVIWNSSDDNILSITNDGVCLAKAEGEVTVSIMTTDGELSDSINITVRNKYKEIGVAYESKWGIECTINELTITTEGTIMYCDFSYTLKNITNDKELTECNFACKKTSGYSESQYGVFNSLIPGESISKTYRFKTLTSDPFIELILTNIFNETINPNADELIWKINQ